MARITKRSRVYGPVAVLVLVVAMSVGIHFYLSSLQRPACVYLGSWNLTGTQSLNINANGLNMVWAPTNSTGTAGFLTYVAGPDAQTYAYVTYPNSSWRPTTLSPGERDFIGLVSSHVEIAIWEMSSKVTSCG